MSKHRPEKYKSDLLISLKKTLGVITPACEEVGLSRDTFYRYYNEDEVFRAAVDDINEIALDFTENQLLKKIKEGSERSILFYMKYKGRKRGYTNTIEVEGNMFDNIKIEIVNPKKDNEEDK